MFSIALRIYLSKWMWSISMTTKDNWIEAEEKLTLTKDMGCRWCGALSGEPCKIQMPVGYVGHPQDYRLGNDKAYFKKEMIHLCRAK